MKWSCPECGFAGSNGTGVPMEAHEFPIHCICGFVESYEEAIDRPVDKTHWLTCPHRGKVIGSLSGQEAGCGCSSRQVEVYHCNYFSDPVLKQSLSSCKEKVQKKFSSYTGRTCKGCNPSVWSKQ